MCLLVCVRAYMSVNTEILKDEHVDTDSTHLLRFWPKYKAACAYLVLSKINIMNGLPDSFCSESPPFFSLITGCFIITEKKNVDHTFKISLLDYFCLILVYKD